VGSNGEGSRQKNALAMAGTREAISEQPEADVRSSFDRLLLSRPDRGAGCVHFASEYSLKPSAPGMRCLRHGVLLSMNTARKALERIYISNVKRILGIAILPLAILTLLLSLESCTKERQLQADANQDGGRTAGESAHFRAGPGRTQRIHDGVNSLKVGDTRAQATALLGPADHEELLGPKEGLDWKCRGLVYYLLIVDQRPGNARDVTVELVFDHKDDKLVAVLSNAEGIASRADMAVCR